MKLIVSRNFEIKNGDGSKSFIEIGFKPDWRFTKRVSVYRNGELVGKTKWATLQGYLSEEKRTPEKAEEFLEMLEHKFKKSVG